MKKFFNTIAFDQHKLANVPKFFVDNSIVFRYH